MIECTQNEFKSDTCPSSNYSWSSSPLYSPNSSLSSSSNPSSISSSNFSSPCQFHRDDIFFPSVPEQNSTESVQRLNSTLDEGSNSSSESSPAKQERLSEQDNSVYTSDLEKIEQSGRSQYAVSYTHLRAHETSLHLVCRLLLDTQTHPPEPSFFFSSRRRHTRCREVSWARRCV